MLTAAGKPCLEHQLLEGVELAKKQAEVTFGADVSME